MKQPVESRLAAILAAHLADNFQPIGADEERRYAALEEAQHEVVEPIIREYRGRIVKTLSDGLVVEFASAVNVAVCAVKLQSAIARHNASAPADRHVKFGIGIHIVEFSAGAGDNFADVLDDAVSGAALLAALADPGSICFSEMARERIGDTLPYPLQARRLDVKGVIARARSVYLLRPEALADWAGALVPPPDYSPEPLFSDDCDPLAPAPEVTETAVDGVRGSILWNPPYSMRVGHRERIEVRIADAGVAFKALSAGLRGRGLPQVDDLEIAPLMRVTLTTDAKDFSVQILSTQDQVVRLGDVARWDFDVTPLRSGRHRLRLLASMRIKIEGKDEIVDLPSYESEVRVTVAPVRAMGQFCAKNWQWISGTVVIPTAVWVVSGTNLGSAALKQLRAWLNP